MSATWYGLVRSGLSLTVSSARRLPAAPGLKAIAMVQLVSGARLVPQLVLTILKAPGLVPPILLLRVTLVA
jgi:hypothetical protein